MDDADDFSDIVDPVSDKAAQRVRLLAAEMRDCEAAVKRAEAAVEDAKADLGRVRDGTLPTALQEAGMDGVEIAGIGFVSWKLETYGSLPSAEKKPDERAWALSWLLANAPSIVKRKLVAYMPKDMPTLLSNAQVEAVVELLESFTSGRMAESLSLGELVEMVIKILVPDTEAETDLDVHPQTLMKWGRECIAEGMDHPYRDLGLVPVQRAKITAPKVQTRTITKAKEI